MRYLRSSGTAAAKLAVTLVLLSAVVFALTSARGDAARRLLGPDASAAQLAIFRQEHDLDRPLPARYLDWLGGALRGDFGRSYVPDEPVWSLVGPRLARSAALAAMAWLLIAAVGLTLGTIAGLRSGGRFDSAVSLVGLTAVAVPEFVIGVLLLALFAVELGWLPANSSGAALASNPLAALSAYVLPACAIAVHGAVHTTRLTRAATREVAGQPYVRAATLRGLPPWRVALRHVVPNAAPPAIGSLAVRLAALVGGVVVIENVFGFPGIGQLLVESAQDGNVPVVLAVVTVVGAAYVLVNVLADGLVALLTPRQELAR